MDNRFYLTVLLYLYENQIEQFHDYEQRIKLILESYGGRFERVIKSIQVLGDIPQPHEIHWLSFPSETIFNSIEQTPGLPNWHLSAMRLCRKPLRSVGHRSKFSQSKVFSMRLRITLVIIAALLLAAHFLRQSEFVLLLLCVLTPFLFLIKKRWSLFALQMLMYLGAIIWANTTVQIVQQRLPSGEPWIRLVIILGGVILFTLVTGFLLNSPVIKERYPD